LENATRSASVVCCSALKTPPWTRVQSSLVAQHAVPSVAIVDEAGHGGDRALEGQDRLVHADVVGRPRQAVAAVGAARGLDELGLAQERNDALEVGEGQALRLGDRLEGYDPARPVLALAPELDEEPHAVLRLRREDHRG
jgi:hypothetical protein